MSEEAKTDYRELEQKLREIPTDINIGWPSDPIDFHAPHVHVDLSALCSASVDAIKALREENERLASDALRLDAELKAVIQDCRILCNALQRIEAGKAEPRMIARRTLEHWSEKSELEKTSHE